MEISITYCSKWNYKPRASSMEEELRNRFGANVKLIAGSGGEYEIVVDGKKIFSKRELNRFPNDGEIEQLIASL